MADRRTTIKRPAVGAAAREAAAKEAAAGAPAAKKLAVKQRIGGVKGSDSNKTVNSAPSTTSEEQLLKVRFKLIHQTLQRHILQTRTKSPAVLTWQHTQKSSTNFATR